MSDKTKTMLLGPAMAKIAARLLDKIPAAAGLMHIGGSLPVLRMLADAQITPMRHRSGPPPHSKNTGTAAYRRKAAKAKAVRRARRLGHA